MDLCHYSPTIVLQTFNKRLKIEQFAQCELNDLKGIPINVQGCGWAAYNEYSKVMVFVFKYSLRASLPKSFPKPDSLKPPKGAATSVLL